MKRETLRHPKTFDLASRLGIDRARALGILTLLWDFTADSAIQGDVGKWPNGSIARACDWLDDADAFVDALIESKWIDRSSNHRLIIHDWPHHCERWVHLKMGKLKLAFVSDYATTEDSTEATAEAPAKPSPPRDRTEPNRTKPNPPPPTPSQSSGPCSRHDVSWEAVEESLLEAGLLEAAAACDKAFERGCSPSKVLEVLAFWRSQLPAWGAGAMLERILRLRESQPVESLWPEPSKPAQMLEARADRAVAAERAAQSRKSAEAARAADDGRFERLEASYGSAVDDLVREEIREILCERLDDATAKLLFRGLKMPPVGMARRELLEHFGSVAKRPVIVSEVPV